MGIFAWIRSRLFGGPTPNASAPAQAPRYTCWEYPGWEAWPRQPDAQVTETANRILITRRRRRGVIDVSTGEGFAIAIVGESYRQVALRKLAGKRLKQGAEVTFTAELEAEPTNPYDENAVLVRISGGAQIGYLSRDDAIAYREMMAVISAAGLIARCKAKLIGGVPGKPSIGAVLDLDDPDAVLKRITVVADGQPF